MTNNIKEYSLTYFVDRKEVDEIKGYIDIVRSNPKADGRVVNVWGSRGAGKSWILHHLKEELGGKDDFKVYYLDLSRYGKKDAVISVLEIIDEFANEMNLKGERVKFGPTPSDASRKLIEAIRGELKRKILLLLIDHVYESNWDLLASLEEYWLGPMAVEPGTFIVMAGRKREYPWKTPELRLRAHSVSLKPFDKDQLLLQLKKRGLISAIKGDLQKVSFGNPLANIVFAINNRKEALEELIDTSLNIAPLVNNKKLAREYLEAISVLQAFDEDRIKAMLAAYFDDDTYRNWTYVQARQACNLLIESSLAHWDEKSKGFVLDEDLRSFLMEYLSTEKNAKWKKLQQAAVKLYEEWQKLYKQAASQWKGEIKYHKAFVK